MIFRSHHDLPADACCATIEALLSEWVSLNDDDHTARLSRLHPLLLACSTPGDVVDLIDRSSSTDANTILYALVMEGSYLARRIVLQALLPKLLNDTLRIARKTRENLDDCLQDRISDFWNACTTYNAASTQWVALNLTRTRNGRHTTPEITEVLYANITDNLLTPATTGASNEADNTAWLNRLLTTALDNGAIDVDDIELLEKIYVEGYTSTELAHEWGLTPASVRKRCQRARQHLAAIPA